MLDPFKHLLEIRTWGTEWKKVIDKIVEWVAWLWTNVKMEKYNLSIMRQSVKISKDDMEDYNLAMFTHVINFFKECVSLKKRILEHFFTSLLNDL
jgi:phage major head subunit gpT-like protein